ncbi:MAG: ParA family protein [Rhodospirillales bacterium]|nr:ParA family protein [Rhodospirillales bacterium]
MTIGFQLPPDKRRGHIMGDASCIAAATLLEWTCVASGAFMAKKGVTMSYLTMKGGVGKTTLAANITRALADISPRKILLIDADAQCNLSQIFLSENELESGSSRSIYQAFDSSHKLYGPSDLKTIVYANQTNHSTIDFIAGSFDTFGLVVATPRVQKRAHETFLQFIEQARSEYDLVVIDTNPSATFVTLQALEVSNFLVAPITFDDFSMRGLDLIVRSMRDQYDWLSNPRRIRIVPNKVSRARDERAAEARRGARRRRAKDPAPAQSPVAEHAATRLPLRVA